MKKIWKMRKDSEAVSPVIATILMVAITVVLAAVLYVMVMGFGGTSSNPPTGSFSAVEKASSATEKVRFGVLTPETKPTEIRILIENGTQSATYTFPSDASGAILTAVAGTPALTGVTSVVYTDLAGNAKLSSGDYLTITMSYLGTGANTYKVTMLWIQNGAAIDDISFGW